MTNLLYKPPHLLLLHLVCLLLNILMSKCVCGTSNWADVVFSLGSAVISVSALQTRLLYREFSTLHQQRSRSSVLDFVMKQNKEKVVQYCEMTRFRLLYLLRNKNQHSKSFGLDVFAHVEKVFFFAPVLH